MVIPCLGEAWRSVRFFQLFVATVLVLLLIPLQLRFRALGAVLIVLYLDAVVVSLATGRYWPPLRWLLLVAGVGALILRTAPVADPDVALLFYVTSRVLVFVVLGACVAAALDYVLRGTVVSMTGSLRRSWPTC